PMCVKYPKIILSLSAMCDLPAPINVTLSSSHFVHILMWYPGACTTSRGRVGQTWEEVAGCEHVQSPLVCSLTKEFSDRNPTYYSQVFAVTNTLVCPSVCPVAHLDPPLVSVRVCGSTLCLDLRPPVDGLRDVNNRFSYKLKIQSNSNRDGVTYFVDKVSLKGKTLKDLAPSREYCVSVSILCGPERRSRNSSYSQPHCTFTTSKYTAGTCRSVVLCLLVMLSGLCTALLVHTGFICLKRPLPETLLNAENLPPVSYDEERFPSVHLVPPSSPSGSNGKDVEMGGGGGYETRGAASDLSSHNPLSSSSSSSSITELKTTSETVSNRPQFPLFITKDQQCESLLRPDYLSMSISNNCQLSVSSQTSQLPEPAECASLGQDLSFSLFSERDTWTVEGLQQMKKEEASCHVTMSVNPENYKNIFQISRKFLQVQSQKPSSAVMKLALIRTATGTEDPELALLQRISSLEL
uniref:Fibronectin type-III domain-containing protein n=1 Tax=Hucho hucho TaxID=62062 RepID=A0A4W5RBX0_9TELE